MRENTPASWQRWEWMHRALHQVKPLGLRMWLRLHVHRRIVQADRILTMPIRLPGGSRAAVLGE